MRNLPTIKVGDGGPVETAALVEALDVVVDGERKTVRDQVPLDHLEAEHVNHFPDNQPSFLVLVRLGEDDAGVDAMVVGTVVFDVSHCGGLITPGVVDD